MSTSATATASASHLCTATPPTSVSLQGQDDDETLTVRYTTAAELFELIDRVSGDILTVTRMCSLAVSSRGKKI